jgi:hypothetical protein
VRNGLAVGEENFVEVRGEDALEACPSAWPVPVEKPEQSAETRPPINAAQPEVGAGPPVGRALEVFNEVRSNESPGLRVHKYRLPEPAAGDEERLQVLCPVRVGDFRKLRVNSEVRPLPRHARRRVDTGFGESQGPGADMEVVVEVGQDNVLHRAEGLHLCSQRPCHGDHRVEQEAAARQAHHRHAGAQLDAQESLRRMRRPQSVVKALKGHKRQRPLTLRSVALITQPLSGLPRRDVGLVDERKPLERTQAQPQALKSIGELKSVEYVLKPISAGLHPAIGRSEISRAHYDGLP